MEFLIDIELHALLPIPEVCLRYSRGEIPTEYFVRAVLGRQAQDEEITIDDDDPRREQLLSIAGQTKDWFVARLREKQMQRAPGWS
jgi:hypothetical protein